MRAVSGDWLRGRMDQLAQMRHGGREVRGDSQAAYAADRKHAMGRAFDG